MFAAAIPDERPIYCEQFIKTLVRALKANASFDVPFNRLSQKINILYPSDRAFRIFNWIVPTEPTHRYYGAIQMNQPVLKLFPLIDCSAQLAKSAEDTILTNGRWYGALYYNIVKQEVDGDPVYFLLGWNGSGLISNKKLIDPVRISGSGATFGAALFGATTESSRPMQRFLLEYKKEVNASLNWDDEMRMIVFDRLVSAVNDPNRKYTYVPSGQYDGFKWVGDRWQMKQDLVRIQQFKDGEAPAPSPRAQK